MGRGKKRWGRKAMRTVGIPALYVIVWIIGLLFSIDELCFMDECNRIAIARVLSPIYIVFTIEILVGLFEFRLLHDKPKIKGEIVEWYMGLFLLLVVTFWLMFRSVTRPVCIGFPLCALAGVKFVAEYIRCNWENRLLWKKRKYKPKS